MEFKSLLQFSKRERRGIIAFIAILALMFTIARLWPVRKYVIAYYDLPENKITLDSTQVEDAVVSTHPMQPKQERFRFNPNLISADSLQLLGFSPFVAKRIVTYRSKGGKINSKEKLKKIYGIDTLLVDALQQYIIYLEDNDTERPPRQSELNHGVKIDTPIRKREKIINIVDINTSDSMAWLDLPGIGSYRASRILSFRRNLGGFLSIEQIKEVPNLPDSIFANIAQYLRVAPTPIRRIDINKADYKTLTSHPYISPKMAKAILQYRKQHGNYENAAHISRIVSISKTEGKRVLPYIKVSE